jgi:hypothetical protein
MWVFLRLQDKHLALINLLIMEKNRWIYLPDPPKPDPPPGGGKHKK